MADPLAGEQAADQADRLLQPVEPLAEAAPEVDPERLVLPFEPAATETQHGAAVAHVIDGRRELCGQARVPERVCCDEQADPGAAGRGRQRGERRPALELGVVRVALVAQEVVVDPEAVGTAPLRGDDGVAEARPVGPLYPEGGPDADWKWRWASLHRSMLRSDDGRHRAEWAPLDTAGGAPRRDPCMV